MGAKEDSEKMDQLQTDMATVKTTLAKGVEPAIHDIKGQLDKVMQRLDDLSYTPLQLHQELSKRVDNLEKAQTETNNDLEPILKFWSAITGSITRISVAVIILVLFVGGAYLTLNQFGLLNK